eukprot:1300638-Rhodomonas_salina.2
MSPDKQCAGKKTEQEGRSQLNGCQSGEAGPVHRTLIRWKRRSELEGNGAWAIFSKGLHYVAYPLKDVGSEIRTPITCSVTRCRADSSILHSQRGQTHSAETFQRNIFPLPDSGDGVRMHVAISDRCGTQDMRGIESTTHGSSRAARARVKAAAGGVQLKESGRSTARSTHLGYHCPKLEVDVAE